MKLPDDSEINSDGIIYLKGIYLEDSWLLGLNHDEELKVLCLKVDLSIWPESKFYSKPLLDDWTCYKKAEIKFIGIRKMTGLFDLTDIKPSIDATGEQDWDCIYGLRILENQCKFEICDREITLIADELQLIIEENGC